MNNQERIKKTYLAGTTSAYQIAKMLDLSYNTVRSHLKKLGLSNQAQDRTPIAYYYRRITKRGHNEIETFYIFPSIYLASKFITNDTGFNSVKYTSSLIRQNLGNVPYDIIDTGSTRWTVIKPALQIDVEYALSTKNYELDYLPEL